MPGGHGSTFPQDGALRGSFLRPFFRLSWHRLSQLDSLGNRLSNENKLKSALGVKGFQKEEKEVVSGKGRWWSVYMQSPHKPQ